MAADYPPWPERGRLYAAPPREQMLERIEGVVRRVLDGRKGTVSYVAAHHHGYLITHHRLASAEELAERVRLAALTALLGDAAPEDAALDSAEYARRAQAVRDVFLYPCMTLEGFAARLDAALEDAWLALLALRIERGEGRGDGVAPPGVAPPTTP